MNEYLNRYKVVLNTFPVMVLHKHQCDQITYYTYPLSRTHTFSHIPVVFHVLVFSAKKTNGQNC